jgi:hypothetical protein
MASGRLPPCSPTSLQTLGCSVARISQKKTKFVARTSRAPSDASTHIMAGEGTTLLAHTSARRRAEEEETGMAVSGPRVARWPVLVIAAVLAAGALDGAARAVSLD